MKCSGAPGCGWYPQPRRSGSPSSMTSRDPYYCKPKSMCPMGTHQPAAVLGAESTYKTLFPIRVQLPVGGGGHPSHPPSAGAALCMHKVGRARCGRLKRGSHERLCSRWASPCKEKPCPQRVAQVTALCWPPPAQAGGYCLAMLGAQGSCTCGQRAGTRGISLVTPRAPAGTGAKCPDCAVVPLASSSHPIWSLLPQSPSGCLFGGLMGCSGEERCVPGPGRAEGGPVPVGTAGRGTGTGEGREGKTAGT